MAARRLKERDLGTKSTGPTSTVEEVAGGGAGEDVSGDDCAPWERPARASWTPWCSPTP